MKARRLAGILFAVALALPLVASGGAVVAQEEEDWFREPRVVGEDDEGDWGADVDPGLAQVGHFLGQDLVEASIGMQDRSTLNFVIRVTFLPPWGGVPEITRYVWNFEVDGEFVELDGKFTNYSRGACDPTSGQCPPPRDPGVAPFLVRGNCETQDSVTLCQELGLVHAEFDAAEGTINIPVPLELIEAKPRSRIVPMMSDFSGAIGGEVIAVPSAFFSSSAAPSDAMRVTKNYRIPKGARP